MTGHAISFALAGWLAVWWWTARSRREHVARACHELRGPLSAAGLALEVMARHGEAPPARIVALEAQLRRAGRALEDLAGAPGAPAHEPVDLSRWLTELHVVWEPIARSRARALVVRDDGTAAVVHADAVRLHQAAGNLIANALEHGTGTVELRLRRVPEGVRLEVRDEGPGFPVALATLIRRPRAGRGARGRGLAIAAAIAAENGGRLATLPGAAIALELPLGGTPPRRLPLVAGAGWRS